MRRGNVYKHNYDNNHNMTQITYSDKTIMKIAYDPKTQFARQVTNRGGGVVKYDYGADSKRPKLALLDDSYDGNSERSRDEKPLRV